MKAWVIGLIFLGIFVFVRTGQAQVPLSSTVQSVYDFKVKTIDGADKSLADYKNQVLLIVNTASHCGHTPQYAGLQKLYDRYKARGFTVLAFPANDFKDQEPGDNSEIKQFCELKYNVTFPLFAKIDVLGPQMAPLYQYLTISSGFPGKITWNFNKFLVDRKGRVIGRFDTKTEPMDPELEESVLRALAQS